VYKAGTADEPSSKEWDEKKADYKKRHNAEIDAEDHRRAGSTLESISRQRTRAYSARR